MYVSNHRIPIPANNSGSLLTCQTLTSSLQTGREHHPTVDLSRHIGLVIGQTRTLEITESLQYSFALCCPILTSGSPESFKVQNNNNNLGKKYFFFPILIYGVIFNVIFLIFLYKYGFRTVLLSKI